MFLRATWDVTRSGMKDGWLCKELRKEKLDTAVVTKGEKKFQGTKGSRGFSVISSRAAGIIRTYGAASMTCLLYTSRCV